MTSRWATAQPLRKKLLTVFMIAASVATAAFAGRPPLPALANADVLVLGSTLQGGTSSPEYQAAQALGLSVEIVDDAGWKAKPAAAFASYKAIVLGDPDCAGDPSPARAATDTVKTWSPAITGNAIIVGTDPDFHYLEGIAGASALIERGIALAVRQQGKTGAYVALSCYYAEAPAPTPIPLLSGLGGGGFVAVGQSHSGVACPQRAHVVDQSLAGIFDADLSNWSCSTHEVFTAWPASYRVLAINEDVQTGYVARDGTAGGPYILGRLAPGSYSALGDSFSSGDGVPPYLDTDGCNRSTNAYGRQVASKDFEGQVRFVACSGSVIQNVFIGRHGEHTQLEALTRPEADVVTISMGGNDIDFAGIARSCIVRGALHLKGCRFTRASGASAAIARIGREGVTPASTLTDASLRPDDPRYNLDSLYAAIREKAPNTRIIVLGYPRMLTEQPVEGCDWVTPNDQKWLNSMELFFDETIAASAARIGAEYIADSSIAHTGYNAFDGHELCTDASWVNDATDILTKTPLHPNLGGQTQFAKEVDAQIAAGPSGTDHLIFPGDTTALASSVGSGLDQVSFSATWPGSDVVMSLISPSGRKITRSTVAPDVIHVHGPTSEVFTVIHPEPGTWTVDLFGASVLPHGENVRFLATPVVHFDRPPIAAITASATEGVSSLRVSFDAGSSSDADGHVVSYAWDFGDGTSATGPTSSHVYGAPGNYQAHLTVTDDSGSQGFAAQDIVVRQPTKTTYTGPTAGTDGDATTLSATLGSDGPIASAAVTFTLGTGPSAQSCAGTTDNTGRASCRLVVHQAPGRYPLSAQFAQTDRYAASGSSATFIVSSPAGGGPTGFGGSAPSAGGSPGLPGTGFPPLLGIRPRPGGVPVWLLGIVAALNVLLALLVIWRLRSPTGRRPAFAAADRRGQLLRERRRFRRP